jgi:hypothetical protein
MTYQSTVLADTPLIYWRLGDPSGTTAADTSGNARPGTYNNGPTLGVPSLLPSDPTNTAVNFTAASSQYVISAVTAAGLGIAGGSAITLEAWIKPTAAALSAVAPTLCGFSIGGGDITLMRIGGAQDLNWALVTSGSGLINMSGGVAFTAGNVYHLVCTYDGAHAITYVNGVQQNSVAATGTISENTLAHFVAAGDFEAADNRWFDGVMDEVALYGTALSAARVLAHYQAGTPTFSRPITDTVGITDGIVRTEALHIALSDTVGITDSMLGGADFHGTLPLLTVASSALAMTMDQPTVPVATAAGQQTLYQILAVDINGTIFAEYPTGQVQSVTWTKNSWEEATFSIPIDAPNLDQLTLPDGSVTPYHEVQIWRNGSLLFWGIPHTRRANSQKRTWDYTAKGLLWYFTKRFVGKANRHNFVTNGDFESGTANWSTVGTGLTVTTPTNQPLNGTHSLKLVGDSTLNANRYLAQQFVIGQTGHIGLALFLTAWFYIESFSGPAALNLGAVINRPSSPNVPGWIGIVNIDANTPKQQWTRIACHIQIPPFTTSVVAVDLYGIFGTIYWDAVTVTAEQSFTLGVGAHDEVLIAKGLVELAQNKGFAAHEFGDSLGKSDLNIGTDTPLSGVLKQRTYFFSDHQQIFSGVAGGGGALDEFPAAEDGFDYRIMLTPHTRTFTTYYPGVGITYTDFTLTWDNQGSGLTGSWGIIGWDFSESIERSANQVTELGGWGTGSGREEGGYTDSASMGGLTLELVESAPNTAPIDMLSQIAQQRGILYHKPFKTPTLTIREPRDPITGAVTYPLIGVLMPGDTVPVDLRDGGVTWQGNYTIATITLDATKEQMTLVPFDPS